MIIFTWRKGNKRILFLKESIDFTIRANVDMSLSPEGTAQLYVAYVEIKLFGRRICKPYKFITWDPMFRYDVHKRYGWDNSSVSVECICSMNPRYWCWKTWALASRFCLRTWTATLFFSHQFTLRYRKVEGLTAKIIAYLEPFLLMKLSTDSQN